jgi:hypothetical protein
MEAMCIWSLIIRLLVVLLIMENGMFPYKIEVPEK